MGIHNHVQADTKADLYATIPGDGSDITLMGNTTRGDIDPLFFMYDQNSSAPDNYPLVIQPTLQTGNGRWIRFQPLQIQADWSAVSGQGVIANKPNLLQQAYEGINKRGSAFPIFKNATVGAVTAGVAIFNLTDDGISTGTALFPNGVIADSINLFVSDAAASYQMSYAFSNSSKTITVTANKLTTANILTGILGQAAATGAIVKLQIWGY